VSEQDLVRTIIDATNATGLAFVWRCQSGRVRVRRGWMHLSPAGTPDVIGWLRDGRFLGIEVKRPGEKPTEIQEECRRRIIAAGGVAAIVRAVAEAVAVVRRAISEAA
jgi:hypothetical protein